jgi:probable selenium-dependent hydroxylase accessory protein YqeC
VVEPIALDELATALELGRHELVSFVGGGGKTTGLFALGAQLFGAVVLTTTTKMARERTDGHHLLINPTDVELTDALRSHRRVLAWRSAGGHKAIGVAAEVCDRWFDLADHVIVEADGSRQRPFTAPNPFEPVVPSRTTLLVACVGAGAFGRVIADRCHRPVRVAALAGCSPGQRLTPERLAAVLSSDGGGRKSCPEGARYAVMLNQVRPSDHTFVDELIDAIDGTVVVVAAS